MKSVAILALAAVVLVTGATTHAATRETGVARLTVAQKHAIKAAGEWHRGCPVWLSELRVLSYRYYGFDKETHIGQIVVNRKVAHPLAKVEARHLRHHDICDHHVRQAIAFDAGDGLLGAGDVNDVGACAAQRIAQQHAH